MIKFGRPIEVELIAEAGDCGAPTMSLPTGFVLEWSTPAVLRMEGLSRCGLKEGTFKSIPEGFWTVSATRAVKNPIGGSWLAILELPEGGVPCSEGSCTG